MPKTYTVKTPKGWHYYYKYNNLFKTGAGFLEKVDVRNDAGYVVAPPSRIEEKTYEVSESNEGVFAEYGVVPDVFIHRSQQQKTNTKEASPAVDPWVTDAITHGATEGQRDDTAMRLAGYFWSRGISQDIIRGVLTQFANNCKPPMDITDVERIVTSVTRYKQTKVRAFTDSVIPEPLCKVTATGEVDIVWPDNGVSISFTNVHRTNERLGCQLTVTHYQVGNLLGPVAFDMMSMSKRKEAVSMLSNMQNEDWAAILDVACRLARNAQEDTEEFVEMSEQSFTKDDSDYLIEYFMPKNQPTLIYADGGTGKSMIALATGMAVSSMVQPIESMNVPTFAGTVLYLDWETDKQEILTRINLIVNGLNRDGVTASHFPITYVRCSAPLATIQPKIQKWIADNGCDLIIVDSLIPALDGDPNDSDTARRFMNALRSFNSASLILSHTSKEGKLFGSSFWWNLSRNVWELSKDQDLNQNHIDLSLVHKKSNNSKLFKPLGIRMNFGPTGVKFDKINILDSNTRLADALSVRVRVMQLLGKQGAMTIKEISQTLSTNGSIVSENAISMACNRGKDQDFVLLVDPLNGSKKWGLRQK